MYTYIREFVISADRIRGTCVHNGHPHARESVAAQSEQLRTEIKDTVPVQESRPGRFMENH